jgi:hypothetical protein
MKLTREIARAIAQDIGDKHRRANGRMQMPWDRSDWEAACDEYERLLTIIDSEVDAAADATWRQP